MFYFWWVEFVTYPPTVLLMWQAFLVDRVKAGYRSVRPNGKPLTWSDELNGYVFKKD